VEWRRATWAQSDMTVATIMTYQKYLRRRPPAMGDLTSVLSTAADVASDPYLPEVICHIQQLKNIDRNEPVTACAETPDGVVGGVGLRNAMVPLRAYVYAQQNVWVYPLALAVILGVPLLLGYELGKGNK
jgi:hypothetical protein